MPRHSRGACFWPRPRTARAEDAALRARLAELDRSLDAGTGDAAAERKAPAEDTTLASAMGLGARVLTEFVAGIAVGALIGWQLDKWLHTSPILLIVFLALGTARRVLERVPHRRQAHRAARVRFLGRDPAGSIASRQKDETNVAAEQAIDPISQFRLEADHPVPSSAVWDFSFTNSSLFMFVVLGLALLLMVIGTSGHSLVPNRLQSAAEMSYEFTANMIKQTAGRDGMRFFPLHLLDLPVRAFLEHPRPAALFLRGDQPDRGDGGAWPCSSTGSSWSTASTSTGRRG